MKIPELAKKALSAVGECPDLDFPAVARVGKNQREIGLLDEPRPGAPRQISDAMVDISSQNTLPIFTFL